MKKILAISMFVLLALINIAIITDANKDFNFKLKSLFFLAKANAENGGTIKWEQDFYDSSGSCIDYVCLNGQEMEKICICDVEYASCPSGQLNNCFVTGVTQTSDPYSCSPGNWTGQSCW